MSKGKPLLFSFADKQKTENQPPPSPLNTISGDTVDVSDLLYGADEIAGFLGINKRKIYYIMERRKIGRSAVPIFNLPSIGLCANKKDLVDYLRQQRQALFLNASDHSEIEH